MQESDYLLDEKLNGTFLSASIFLAQVINYSAVIIIIYCGEIVPEMLLKYSCLHIKKSPSYGHANKKCAINECSN